MVYKPNNRHKHIYCSLKLYGLVSWVNIWRLMCKIIYNGEKIGRMILKGILRIQFEGVFKMGIEKRFNLFSDFYFFYFLQRILHVNVSFDFEANLNGFSICWECGKLCFQFHSKWTFILISMWYSK